jgi:shikimate dehydrogenase
MKYSALIGNPVEHSVSDIMFVLFAEKLGINYSHLKIMVKDKRYLKKSFGSMCNLGFSGFNITLPYKTDSIKFLDKLDASVLESGAVNTVKIKDGKYIGYNTDCEGFIKSCDILLKPISSGDIVFIFGAGGAARAVLTQVAKCTKNIYVFNRSEKRLLELKKSYGSKIKEYLPLDDCVILEKIIELNPNYYFNTTSLGMKPNIESSPIPQKLFKHISDKSYFLDAVFNPYETNFIKYAKKTGAKTVPGIYWMIYQGIVAFNIWNDTNLSLSNNKIKNVVDKLIQRLKK